MGEIVWLGRYPVKSMLGEEPDRIEVTPPGVVGDRRYALVDLATGLVASAKNPRVWRRLLSMAARYDDAGRLRVVTPDGAVHAADDPDIDELLFEATGRRVWLAATRPEGAELERESPPVEADAGRLARGVLAAADPGDTFVDFAPVHVVTTATLRHLARQHPQGRVEARRFRPNVVLRMIDAVPLAENGWPGRTMTARSGTALRFLVPTPRCAVPALAHGDLPEDPDVLRTAARVNRTSVLDLGVRTCVGVYATIERPGPLAVGDVVRVR